LLCFDRPSAFQLPDSADSFLGGTSGCCAAAGTGLAVIAGPYGVAEIAAGVRCITISSVISLVGLRAELSHGKPTGFDTEIQKNDQE
jgi:hypothetical protein